MNGQVDVWNGQMALLNGDRGWPEWTEEVGWCTGYDAGLPNAVIYTIEFPKVVFSN